MALTERAVIGKIEILEDGQIQLREDTVIERDGVVIHRAFHRRVLAPGHDLTQESDARLKTIATAIWTPKVVEDFEILKAEREASAVI